ncbi:hypothetical protein ACIPK7_06260 [Pseudomonas sp. NPDC086581]|uniref:hypothetical protein n=1 Tax=Pseudomonas sp. NPDC086581 TaxID=3364432 RepID=UPI00380F8101
MPVLLNIANKQDSSDIVSVPATGDVQLFIRGSLGSGKVVVSLKGPDGQFHTYDGLTFSQGNVAQQISLLAGDQLRIECIACKAAAVEVRQ